MLTSAYYPGVITFSAIANSRIIASKDAALAFLDVDRVAEVGVLLALREVDQIAYVRYASEYLEFRTIDDLAETVNELKSRPQALPNQEKLFE